MKKIVFGIIKSILLLIGLIIALVGWFISLAFVFVAVINGDVMEVKNILFLILAYFFSTFGGYLMYKTDTPAYLDDSVVISLLVNLIFGFSFLVFDKIISLVTKGKVSFM
ncbi:hypothetical protein [Priestia megaterium]|uniref:Uncharacterized protein n=1 Tax=Priestia megaterium TaxID=1404 RepID=A0A6M6E8M0_PRIMG|nr:hypothetical protein [Priestia megaterium]QJX80768.1 hypothetical protein FDZ14_32270 [Priestia megaterium]